MKLLPLLLVIFLLAGCNRGLPPSLERDVSIENDRVQNALRQVEKSQASLAKSSDLASWSADVTDAKAEIAAAQSDGRQLVALVERNRPDRRIAELLADERRHREAAIQKSKTVDEAVARWQDYKRDPAAFVARINHEKEAIRTFDFAPVKQAVQHAEKDWPAKKAVLESRLALLSPNVSAAVATAPAALMLEEETLAHQAETLGAQTQQLQNECGQLYDSWDKILTDLDRSESGPDTLYRERIKTIRTHLLDVPLKKSETHSDEHWTEVSPSSFHAVENDIGMAIAHKDAGLFDSEATNTPQPPGFSYVASPSVGSNQYGYWSHSGGESIWTFLPQYLILRELLWNHDYRPVMATEYNAYRAAQSRGTTYYGRETPTAAPKYGTHGTFTQTHYGDSRYVQAGGFKGSAYASNGSSGLGQSPKSFGEAQSGPGRRFGRQPGAEPSGQRFGHAPSPRPAGRSFGRRR